MTLHLHFTLKISADLFGSLEIKLSAQPSFENLSEFGLCAYIQALYMYCPVLLEYIRLV